MGLEGLEGLAATELVTHTPVQRVEVSDFIFRCPIKRPILFSSP